MSAFGNMQFPTETSSDDRDLLAVSGLLDETYYRLQADVPHAIDPLAHYLEEGWMRGMNPSPGFDGEFLRPYYEASGRYGPPALTWLQLSVMPGRRPPKNYEEAAWLAEKLRGSRHFDVNQYAKRVSSNVDPVLHYVVIGELLGWPPSQEFDPKFYLESNPDLADSGLSPLCHYIDNGHREGRSSIPTARTLPFPGSVDQRPVILVVVHDASRTGIPILGWNIARSLAKSYNVVSILMRGGTLEKDFTEISSGAVGPIKWERWNSIEMKYLAERLSTAYKPLYAIGNSVETHSLLAVLARVGIPTVALIHELIQNVNPPEKMLDMFGWASHIVFPCHLVARAAFSKFPAFTERRGIHVLSWGSFESPKRGNIASSAVNNEAVRINQQISCVRSDEINHAFVVVGLATSETRKGVDIFIETAAYVRRLQPDVQFRFIWVGDGYAPVREFTHSAYLAEQILRSGLSEVVLINDTIHDLESVYFNTDMCFMCSPLDPGPNVGVDAVFRGIPTVCFENACGAAEILNADPETRVLVTLDAHAAAEVICRFAVDRAALAGIGAATARVGRIAYNMEAYIDNIDGWGRKAAASLHPEDLRSLADAKIVDPDLAFLPGECFPGAFTAEKYALQQWSVFGASISAPQFRRPCAGFHPQIFADAHSDVCGEGGANPLAHWLRCGRPQGRWSRQVFSPVSSARAGASSASVALHSHFYYELGASDLAARLAMNKTVCDLFVSTDTEAKSEHIRRALSSYRGRIDVRVVPNRGRDLGPFLTGLAHEISSEQYDIFGHIHSKRSVGVDETGDLGTLWREFLWENLVGGTHAMLDLAINAFERHQDIGLLIAEDPHLVGWDKNRENAEALAKRIGVVGSLDNFFDFPLGTMFWARTNALRPLMDLRLDWEDYPAEPLPNDGTILHALERLLPYATRHVGFRVAGLRAPGTTW